MPGFKKDAWFKIAGILVALFSDKISHLKISVAASVKLNTWCDSVTVSFLALLTSEQFHFYHCHHHCLPYLNQDAACHPKGKEWKSQSSRRRSWDLSEWRSVLKSQHFLHLTIPMCFLLPLHPLGRLCFSMHLNCVFCLKPAHILPLLHWSWREKLLCCPSNPWSLHLSLAFLDE